MEIKIVRTKDLNDSSGLLLLDNGKIKLLSSEFYDKLTFDDIRYFCHMHARYGIPTIESVDIIKEIIGGRSAIEIGSGHGDLGYHLGIKKTDSKIQLNPKVKARYDLLRQPIINYPDDVEKIDAVHAVKKYKPQVVVASWITTYSKDPQCPQSSPYGIKEKSILELVETFILVGSVPIHGSKQIMKLPHDEIASPCLISRSKRHENRIWIWNNK